MSSTITDTAAVSHVVVGFLQENCYVVDDGQGGVCLVDPGSSWPVIEEAVAGRKVSLVLVTHFHDDHVGALNDVIKATGAPWVAGAYDAVMLSPGHRDLPGVTLPPVARHTPKQTFMGGETVEAGARSFQVIPCPGHSRGGMSYYEPTLGVVFSGDTLFAGTAGRTELYGGYHRDLLGSLVSLSKLPAETLVFPGHGPSTTIGAEVASNPFVREALGLRG